jgi:hypothetical protein
MIAAAFMWKSVTNHVSLFQGSLPEGNHYKISSLLLGLDCDICFYQDVTEKELTNKNPFGA